MILAKKGQGKSYRASMGFEAPLWAAADRLRGHLDAAQYERVVLVFIFFKYISDSFEELRARLITEQAEEANPEEPEEYRAENVFWVPPKVRTSDLHADGKTPLIGTCIDLLRELGGKGRDLLDEYY
jgi:type I restriction enzyme M protein